MEIGLRMSIKFEYRYTSFRRKNSHCSLARNIDISNKICYTEIVPIEEQLPGKQKDSGTWLKALHWYSERRPYEATEETNSVDRDGFSN
jgi:hypothetical protein